jgi:hypothetical protein
MRLDWKMEKLDRGFRFRAETPFGPMIVIDDGNHRMCTAHPIRNYTYFGNASTVDNVIETAEAAYFAAIETEYEEKR